MSAEAIRRLTLSAGPSAGVTSAESVETATESYGSGSSLDELGGSVTVVESGS